MKVSALIAQLGLRSELVDWYEDAKSVPCGHMLIDSSLRTDDQLRYCTNTGSIPSYFYNSDRLEQSIVSDDELTKSLYTSIATTIFPQMQKSFPSIWPKRVYQVPLRMYSESSQRKPAEHKTTSRDRFSKRSSNIFSKMKKDITTPVNDHLS